MSRQQLSILLVLAPASFALGALLREIDFLPLTLAVAFTWGYNIRRIERWFQAAGDKPLTPRNPRATRDTHDADGRDELAPQDPSRHPPWL